MTLSAGADTSSDARSNPYGDGGDGNIGKIGDIHGDGGDAEVLLSEVELGQLRSSPSSSSPPLPGEGEERKTPADVAAATVASAVDQDDGAESSPSTAPPTAAANDANRRRLARRRRQQHMVWGYIAAALNVAFDTWGTVLTKQHGTRSSIHPTCNYRRLVTRSVSTSISSSTSGRK